MGETIHEQTGLRISKNEKNGFTVCRLHYTADPRKRSPEWKAAARRGMSEAQFEQEFEINYDAKMGEKVFPEIRDRRDEIVFRGSPYFDNLWPTSLQMWGGFDYGAKNPSSFHVYTIVDGVTYAIWELYEPCRNIHDFVAAMKACPYWNQIRYIAHDPDMSNLKQRDLESGGVMSIRQHFERLGITKWVTGNNDEQAWLVSMRRHWCGPEITFKISEMCPKMIDEFEHATYISMTEKQLADRNYREALVDKYNHALDDCKYFMNLGIERAPKQWTIRNLVDSYGGSSGSSNRPRPVELGPHTYW